VSISFQAEGFFEPDGSELQSSRHWQHSIRFGKISSLIRPVGHLLPREGAREKADEVGLLPPFSVGEDAQRVRRFKETAGMRALSFTTPVARAEGNKEDVSLQFSNLSRRHAKPLYLDFLFMHTGGGEVVGGLHAAEGVGFQTEGFFKSDGHIG
jgi:hypothetical protein